MKTKNFLSGLKKFFCPRFKNNPDNCPQFENLLKMPDAVFHPCHMMEGLGVAISFRTQKPVMLSVSDVELYEITASPEGRPLFFWGVRQNGLLYGNIIGSPYISVCSEQAYPIKKVRFFDAPLQRKKGKDFFLHCRYDRKKLYIAVESLDQIDIETSARTTLRRFTNTEQKPSVAWQIAQKEISAFSGN